MPSSPNNLLICSRRRPHHKKLLLPLLTVLLQCYASGVCCNNGGSCIESVSQVMRVPSLCSLRHIVFLFLYLFLDVLLDVFYFCRSKACCVIEAVKETSLIVHETLGECGRRRLVAERVVTCCSCAQKAREAADLWGSHRTRHAANLTMKLGIWL